jgi:phosphopantetheine--protein transferase-like protein
MTSIYGVGVDQVNLDRVRKLLNKNKSKFETRCFTKNEILYANRFNDPSKRLGARFAGKEAVMKSLGKGMATTELERNRNYWWRETHCNSSWESSRTCFKSEYKRCTHLSIP